MTQSHSSDVLVTFLGGRSVGRPQIRHFELRALRDDTLAVQKTGARGFYASQRIKTV
jgi:hypothetical protein